MRRPIVVGNWKMHTTVAAARELVSDLRARLAGDPSAEVVVCPPFTVLAGVADLLGPIALGAQDLHWERAGAFTGEVSAEMLLDAGCRWVIVGHSERRSLFGETDADVARKAGAALRAGLRPIVCVGETLDEREAERTAEVLRRQVETGLAGLGQDLARAVVAYEPVWAIGTGRTASREQAQQAHALIRETVGRLAGPRIAETLRIQYGGSLKPANAAGLFAEPDVDGGLVGGASLDGAAFADIVRAAG